jgi:hypothetical protein
LSERQFPGSSPELGENSVDKPADGNPIGKYSATKLTIAYFLGKHSLAANTLNFLEKLQNGRQPT